MFAGNVNSPEIATMLNEILASFYERDLRKLTDEINAFHPEADLWETRGSVKNSAGNLALHIVGGLNYLIGTQLAGTGYVRQRDAEFSSKGIPREKLLADLEAGRILVTSTLRTLSPELDEDFPIPFDDAPRSNCYVLVQLHAHLNYHLGQINYIRRLLQIKNPAS